MDSIEIVLLILVAIISIVLANNCIKHQEYKMLLMVVGVNIAGIILFICIKLFWEYANL